jgi:hypothetical protein
MKTRKTNLVLKIQTSKAIKEKKEKKGFVFLVFIPILENKVKITITSNLRVW